MPQAIALSTLVLLSSSVAPARAADPAAATVPAPASVTTVGTLRVERYGSGEPAMIFVPGLSCGSWVWRDAVTHYAGTHAVYLVTLAGFDGLPSTGAGIEAADASLLQLMTTEKLTKPIVVGHSLGGYLALRFGTEHATLVRGIVAIDGLPILPQFLQTPAADRIATADKIAAQIRTSTPEQYAAGQKTTLATMITSPSDVDRAAALSAKSDPKAVATYFDDLMRDDLRPALPKLAVPTLEIAPVPTEPAPYEGPQAANASLADRASGYKAFYTTLFPGAPNVTVETVLNSKHFVMIDQPKALYDDITSFVATLPA